jgi:hypothetical protein
MNFPLYALDERPAAFLFDLANPPPVAYGLDGSHALIEVL